TLAGFASTTAHVEGETSGVVAACPGFGHAGKQFADRCEHAGVGCRVAPRRAADGTLVHRNDLVEVLQAFQRVVWRRFRMCPVQRARDRRGKRVVDQGGLSRAGYARDAYKMTCRDSEIDRLQVVASSAFQT